MQTEIDESNLQKPQFIIQSHKDIQRIDQQKSMSQVQLQKMRIRNILHTNASSNLEMPLKKGLEKGKRFGMNMKTNQPLLAHSNINLFTNSRVTISSSNDYLPIGGPGN